MDANQPSFTDAEYNMRRRVSKRQEFLDMMDQVIPWDEWVGIIRPFYYDNRRGRRAKPIQRMLRMYLLQCWFNLSDEAVEDQIYDSFAMRRFMRIDFNREQVPDATTLLGFRHLMEEHQIGKMLFDALNRLFEANGYLMRGGTVVDATIISAPSSTKNTAGARDRQAHQTRKGNQWYFGFKAHAGVDAGTGYVHTISLTPANIADIDQISLLVRPDDQVVYADAGYTGITKRDQVATDPHLAGIDWRVAPRKAKLKTMPLFDQHLASIQAGVRAKVEHLFLILKRDFGFTKTRYRGLAKNLNRLHMLGACANLLMRARATRITQQIMAG